MSEVKVNKISPRTNCGTVTVGDSGDSVSVTAGVPVTVNGDLKSSALKAPDGGVIVSQCGTANTLGASGDTVTVAGNDLRSDAYKAADGGVIISQSGTNITIGASGDTVSLASGASQSGFGRTGTVDWETTPKTSTFTAASGEGYFVNTTSGEITMNLPAGSAGAIVSAQDYNNTFDSNKLIITPNGSEKINGGTGSIELTTEGEGLTLVYIDSTVGWRSIHQSVFTDVGTNELYIAASGGNATLTCGNFKTHVFTGPGTFTVSCAGNSCGSNILEYLVVAGGGGGGGGGTEPGNKFQGAGGGGAGGWRSFTSISPASPSNAPAGLTASATAYPITVGAGGAGDPSNSTGGSRGANSVFSTITSTGGGGGGSKGTPIPAAGGNKPGGSGGGGAGQPDPACRMDGGTGNTPPVSPVQGFNGGRGASRAAGPNSCSGAGGGGGASAEGVVAPNCSIPGGAGGAGQYIPTAFIGPTAPSYGETGPAGRVFAGGGGGGGGGGAPTPVAAGGLGGGGDGGIQPADPTAGVANTGGGAGGGHGTQGTTAGGSGIVMIRYRFQ